MWVTRNQRKLKVDLYSGLRDITLRGDTTYASIQKITCNAKWIEIENFLSKNYGQKVEDLLDIITSIFKIKFNQLLQKTWPTLQEGTCW